MSARFRRALFPFGLPPPTLVFLLSSGDGKKEDKPPIGIGGETTGNRVAKPVQALPKRTQAPPPPPPPSPITDDPHEAQVTQPVLLPVDPVASGETGGKGKSSSVKVIDEDDGVEGGDKDKVCWHCEL